MDSKKLAAFLAVQRLGTLTRAAEALNYTQSGMTHMMNALEKELGIPLLERGRNGVALTPAALQLLPKIEALVASAEALEKELAEMKGRSSSGIRVGAYSSMGQHWLPEIMRRFLSEMPGVPVDIRMVSVAELYDMLKSGALDCAFVSYQASEFTGALDWIPLRNDELVAILPSDYPVRGGLFSVGDFADQNFLMPANGFDRDIAPVFAHSSAQPRIRLTNMDDPAIISMVEHGLGLSILSELVMRGRQDNVQALPLTPPGYRELGIAFLSARGETEPLASFIRCARATVMELYHA